MKKFIIALATLICLFFLFSTLFISCKKNIADIINEPPNNPPPGNHPPATTAIGTPVGYPVTKNIGANGGSLLSPDGRLQLNIPAGSLSANTDISIQPVTNEAPSGVGLSYQLLPEGIAFGKPVTITFHYTDEEVNGSHPYFLLVAYQDSAQSWHADRVNRDLDTVAKTVSIASTHFSIWSAVDEIRLQVDKDEFKANETGPIKVIEVLNHGEDLGDELNTLATSSSVPDNIVSNWTLKGGFGSSSTNNGQITGSGSEVTYAAPGQIDVDRFVQVSTEVKYHLIIYNKGKKIAEFNKFILFTTLSLLSDQLDYTLELQIEDGELDISGYSWSYNYSDHAKMDVKVTSGKVTISNIENFPMVFGALGGHCSVAYDPDSSIEALNINDVKGYISGHTFNLDIFTEKSKGPKYIVTCPETGTPSNWGPIDIATIYTSPDFQQRDSLQTVTYTVDSSPYYYVKYILTPKN